MSSTDDTRLARRVRRFFEDALMPAANALETRAGRPFATGPEPELGSYYVNRRRRRMEPVDFELDGLGSPENLSRVLVRFWEDRATPELAALAAPLAGLALETRGVEESAEEVSPFIYVMF